jgi:hypothetical protein
MHTAPPLHGQKMTREIKPFLIRLSDTFFSQESTALVTSPVLFSHKKRENITQRSCFPVMHSTRLVTSAVQAIPVIVLGGSKINGRERGKIGELFFFVWGC